jgi:putative colanic acid biosynthesis acetyltransferase WcaB
MNFFQFIVQDWDANKDSGKGRAVMFLFRIANFCSTRRIYFYIGFFYILFYKVFVQWLFTLEIPWNIVAGKNLAIYHGQALIINKDVVIGENCTLRHCTTIGRKQKADGTFSGSPVIGDNVDIGNNVCIIGGIHLQNNVKVGSGSVVVKDVAAGCIVAGNPAKVISTQSIVNQDQSDLKDRI